MENPIKMDDLGYHYFLETPVYIYLFKHQTHITISLTFPYLFYLSFSRDLKKRMPSTLIFGKRKNGISGHPGASRPCCYEAAVQKRFNRAADVAEVGVTRRTFFFVELPVVGGGVGCLETNLDDMFVIFSFNHACIIVYYDISTNMIISQSAVRFAPKNS